MEDLFVHYSVDYSVVEYEEQEEDDYDDCFIHPTVDKEVGMLLLIFSGSQVETIFFRADWLIL